MWNTLNDNFIKETASANRRAIARAVVGYCDGMDVFAFTGETLGTIADTPRGNRNFYWDTVFVPDDPTGKSKDKTYAEINDDPNLGLIHKVVHLSQSTRAMLQLLEFLRKKPPTMLWRS
jgi:inosine/xanthosine triphosphate pyrophosphatase family protein